MTQPVAMNLISPETKDYKSVLNLACQHLNQITGQRVSAVARAKKALDEKYGFDGMSLEERLEMRREAENALNCPQETLRVQQSRVEGSSVKADARRRARHRREEREGLRSIAEVNRDGEARVTDKPEVESRNEVVEEPEAWVALLECPEALVVAALASLKQHADVDVEEVLKYWGETLEVDDKDASSSTLSKTGTANESYQEEQPGSYTQSPREQLLINNDVHWENNMLRELVKPKLRWDDVAIDGWLDLLRVEKEM